MTRREQGIQQACVQWFDYQYASYSPLLYANYNNAHNKKQGGINKSMGVRAGVADLTFIFAGKIHYIELKAGKNKQEPEQITFQQYVTDQGASYYIIRSLDEFMDLINSIIPQRF